MSTGSLDKPPTIYDVARAAGVSAQTVSRLITGYQGIRPETRTKVQDAIDLLGYRPNMAARSLITRKSHRLGLLTHLIDEVGPSRIMQGAAAAAREAGYLVDIVTLDASDSRTIREALDLVTSHDVAGVLALGSTDETNDAFRKTPFKVPAYIAAGPRISDREPKIPDEIPLERGLADVVDHLVELGHERIAYVGGPLTWAAATNRKLMLDWALGRKGLHTLADYEGDWSSASGYRAATQLRLEDGVTAIIAANDQMAIGVILALTERGLSVPDDISVTGVDDIPEAAYLNPPLTTIRMDFASQGRDAVEQLLALVEEREPRLPVQRPPELVVRRSTARAR